MDKNKFALFFIIFGAMIGVIISDVVLSTYSSLSDKTLIYSDGSSYEISTESYNSLFRNCDIIAENKVSDRGFSSVIVPPSRFIPSITFDRKNVLIKSMNNGNLTIIEGSGNSMKPFRSNESSYGVYQLIDNNFGYENIRVGDIVSYLSNNDRHISHRIISINNTHFIAKGDNNVYSDDVQTNSKIEAVLVGVFY